MQATAQVLKELGWLMTMLSNPARPIGLVHEIFS
jgi:hypothetical protein